MRHRSLLRLRSDARRHRSVGGHCRIAWAPAARRHTPDPGDESPPEEDATTYTVTVNDSAGASLRGSVTVWSSYMNASASASPDEISPGVSSQLTAHVDGGTPPYSFSWAPAASLDDPGRRDPIASPTVTTDYTVTVTDAAGVTLTRSARVAVAYMVISATASPGFPHRIIPGDTSQLNATVVSGGTPPYSFAWRPAGSLDDPTRHNPVASPTVTTDYTVTVTDATGVSVEKTVEVDVERLLVRASALPTTINPGQSSQLNATIVVGTPPFEFFWFPRQSLDSGTLQNPVASPAVTTTYGVTALGGLDADSSHSFVTVTVNLVANPAATPATIDAGQAAMLDANPRGGDGAYSYTWSPAAGLSDPTIRNPIASPAATTNYTVTVTDGNGATHVGSVAVTVNAANPPPAAFFSPSTRAARQESISTRAAAPGRSRRTRGIWIGRPRVRTS